MIDIYVHTIYFANGDRQTFDSETPIDFPDDEMCKINFTASGNKTCINMKNVNTISITHLTLTEEEFQKRQELLKK